MSQPKRIGIKPLRPKPSQVLEITNVQPNPQFVWQMQVSPGYAYRSYRIPSLYPGVQW